MGRWKLAGAFCAACALLSLALHDVRSRAQFVGLKLAGELPTIAWSDIASLLSPGAVIWREPPWASRNPYWAFAAPPASPADVGAGQILFSEHCSTCHDSDADGSSLAGGYSARPKQGASDLALFSTIRSGVPGTTMAATDLTPREVWQVVAYLRHAALASNSPTPPPPATISTRLNQPVSKDVSPLTLSSSEWATYHGGLDGQRHGPLSQIDRNNVAGLTVAWQLQLPQHQEPLQVTPLVVDGRMYVNLPTGDVWGLDASTGAVLWQHPGEALPPDLQRAVEGAGSRGPAVSGSLLFVPTLDARLIALDSHSGTRLWEARVADHRQGYSIVGAPLVAGSSVVVGVAGSDRGVRGFLAAFSPVDGRRLWQFDTVPAPGEPGHESWERGSSWQRGGGLTSMTGTYDPESGLVYWGVGNPSPAFEGDVRRGDNLYTSSVIAVDAVSGELRWHFQVVPHDEWDWGVTHVPVLVNGRSSAPHDKLLYLASRNGFFYALDRTDGRFLGATAFAAQTWNDGFDASGRPHERPHSRPTLQGTLGWPGHAGATGWQPPAYDPSRDLFFVATRDGYGNVFYKTPKLSWRDGAFWGGKAEGIAEKISPAAATRIVALSGDTGDLRWSYRFPGETRYSGGGLLSTSGGLVFAGEKNRFVALDADTGAELWHVETDGLIDAAPITYAANGRQRVAVAAGRSILVFALGTP